LISSHPIELILSVHPKVGITGINSFLSTTSRITTSKDKILKHKILNVPKHKILTTQFLLFRGKITDQERRKSS